MTNVNKINMVTNKLEEMELVLSNEVDIDDVVESIETLVSEDGITFEEAIECWIEDCLDASPEVFVIEVY